MTIQAMVFGNMGDTSGTGVAFTRNPSTGEPVFFGEFLANAQGEDVVSGDHTPTPINFFAQSMPDVYTNLQMISRKLERYYRDMQDLELTVENGALLILQPRIGKRSALAAVRIAADMVNERLLPLEEARDRIGSIKWCESQRFQLTSSSENSRPLALKTKLIQIGSRELFESLLNNFAQLAEDCRQDMIRLGPNEHKLVLLVESEFRSHANYFIFDLEHYPLPIGTQFIVYLTKTGSRIEFERVAACSRDEAQLAKWNHILTLARRATRLAYRDDPSKIAFSHGIAERARELHNEIAIRLRAYYAELAGLTEAYFALARAASSNGNSAMLELAPEQILLHLRAAHAGCDDVEEIL